MKVKIPCTRIPCAMHVFPAAEHVHGCCCSQTQEASVMNMPFCSGLPVCACFTIHVVCTHQAAQRIGTRTPILCDVTWLCVHSSLIICRCSHRAACAGGTESARQGVCMLRDLHKHQAAAHFLMDHLMRVRTAKGYSPSLLCVFQHEF